MLLLLHVHTSQPRVMQHLTKPPAFSYMGSWNAQGQAGVVSIHLHALAVACPEAPAYGDAALD